MARYEHLPIYKQALDVAVHFEQVVSVCRQNEAWLRSERKKVSS